MTASRRCGPRFAGSATSTPPAPSWAGSWPCARLRPRTGSPRASRSLGCRELRDARGRDGQRDAEARAAPLADVAGDRAAVRLDDVARNGEPEPGPLPLGGEERI